jgi:glycosyltransferase involved in cell wall biosynthesis
MKNRPAQKNIKVAYLLSHPIQYQSPMLKYISHKQSFDLEVLYLSNMSVEGYRDSEFQFDVKWDTPLLNGYKYKFLNSIGFQNKISFLFPLCLQIFNELKNSKYDYLWVHGWGSLTNIFAIISARKLGIKVLIRGESNLVLPKGSRIKQMAKFIFLKWLFKNINYFMAIGTLNRKFYEYYGVKTEKIILMPYAVDNEFFQRQSQSYKGKVTEFKKLNDINQESKLILYASKLTNRKNSIDLLLAYEKLLNNFSDNKPYLFFVGSGEEHFKLSKIVSEKRLDRVRLCGFKNQSELPEFFEACDIFVLPSSAEPWGLVVNEVMNHSKPVIVSDEVGCGADLVEHGVNGFIFKCRDIDDLSNRLMSLLEDNEKLTGFSCKSLMKINSWSFEEDFLAINQALGQNHSY